MAHRPSPSASLSSVAPPSLGCRPPRLGAGIGRQAGAVLRPTAWVRTFGGVGASLPIHLPRLGVADLHTASSIDTPTRRLQRLDLVRTTCP